MEAEIEFLQSQLDHSNQKSKSDMTSIMAIKESKEAALREEIDGLQEQLRSVKIDFVAREDELLDLIRHLQAMRYSMPRCMLERHSRR